MATFSKSAFNAANYASSRPTYPVRLFDYIQNYRNVQQNAQNKLAVDLGCGTGQATVELSSYDRIVAIDPSAGMLKNAKIHVESKGLSGKCQFLQGHAESIAALGPASVDHVITAQAGHWFDWHALWPVLAQTLKVGGTVAVWGYTTPGLADYPNLQHLLNGYLQGSDPETSVGFMFEQPGRNIIENLLRDVPEPPVESFCSERAYFTGRYFKDVDAKPIIMKTVYTWQMLEAWLRTASALMRYADKYPEDAKREDGDVTTRFIKRLQAAIEKQDGQIKQELRIDWPIPLILARRT